MLHTRIERWLREPPETVRRQLELRLDTRYTWTGYSPHIDFEERVVWQLHMWNISDHELVLIDAMLCEYYVAARPSPWSNSF